MIILPFLVTPPMDLTRLGCSMTQFNEISRMNSLKGVSFLNS